MDRLYDRTPPCVAFCVMMGFMYGKKKKKKKKPGYKKGK